MLLHFFSAYAGVISGDPAAALLAGDYYLAAPELDASAAAMEKQPG